MNNSVHNSLENNAAHVPGKLEDIARLVVDAILPFTAGITNNAEKADLLHEKADEFFYSLEPYIVDNKKIMNMLEGMNQDKYEQIKTLFSEIIDIIHNKPEPERKEYSAMLRGQTSNYIYSTIYGNNSSHGGRRRGRGRTHHRKHKTRKARHAHKKRHTRRHKRRH